jgi:phage/plasmid primase-like uncharacterized protein
MEADTSIAASLNAIRSRIGGDLYDGGRRLICPGPGHAPRDRSLSVLLTPQGRVVFHSFAGDDLAACVEHLGLEGDQGRRMTSAEARKAEAAHRQRQAAERSRKGAHCAQVWEATQPGPGSLVEVYLRGRGITVPIPPTLRFHENTPAGYGGPGFGPAMVAKVEDGQGQMIGLHLTFLRPDGSGKADMDRPKRMFGSVGGGAVRMSDHQPDAPLAIAEGIETALSYQQLKAVPTWACLSTLGIERVQLPAGVRQLIVAADGDEAGLRAARAKLERHARGASTALDAPPLGRDWNDVLKEVAP